MLPPKIVPPCSFNTLVEPFNTSVCSVVGQHSAQRQRPIAALDTAQAGGRERATQVESSQRTLDQSLVGEGLRDHINCSAC